MADYVEQILQATGIVVENYLNQLAFDRTEDCVIIDASGKKDGKYVVSNGSMKFDAYVNTSGEKDKIPTYKLNDSVRVSVPNGDYTQKKYIEGLSVKDDSNPITYVSPLDSMLDITGNIVNTTEDVWGLCANNNQEENVIDKSSGKTIWSISLTDAAYKDLYGSDIFDTIALKADFKTLLSQYNMKSGNYGLSLVMTFDNGSTKRVNLDSSEMFGNPYSFSIYSTQAIKFAIKPEEIITNLQLIFYQNGNFTYLDNNNKLSSKIKSKTNNILIKNIYLSLGSDILSVEDNTFKIFSNDERQYNQDNKVDVTSTDEYKEFGLLWYNKDENGKYIGFSDGLSEEGFSFEHEGKKITQYDEFKYKELSNADGRLTAQKGKNILTSKIGLALSANIEEEQTLYSQIYKLINNDLWQDLKAFENRVGNIIASEDAVKEIFSNILTGEKDENRGLPKFILDIDTEQKAMVKRYTDILAFGRQQQKAKILEQTIKDIDIPDEINDIKDSLAANKFLLNIQAQITGAKSGQIKKNDDQIYVWIKKVDPTSNSENNLFNILKPFVEGDYQSYKGIYDSFSNRIKKIVEKIKELCDSINNLVLPNDNKAADAEELQKILEQKITDFEEYKVKDLSSWDNRYCTYWYRYNPSDEADSTQLLGKNWQLITENKKLGSAKTIHNLGVPKGYQTGVDGALYNIERDVSEILGIYLDPLKEKEKIKAVLFYNHTMYVSNEIEFTNENPPIDGPAADLNGALFIEHGENSRETYQAYGVNNCLVNAADVYKPRYLRVKYDGELGKDEYLNGAQVYWYIPKNSTMLSYSNEDFPGKWGFTNDAEDKNKSDMSMDGYVCFYRTITEADDSRLFPYRIKNYYSQSFSKNEIICKVIPKGSNIITEATIVFTFSSYGTSGTDYTLTVSPTSNYSQIIKDGELELQVKIFDYKNEEVKEISNIKYSWEGPSHYEYIPDENENNKVKIKLKEDPGYAGPGILKVKVEHSFEEKDVSKEGEIKTEERIVDLVTYYPISWSSDTFYIEGASVVIYDSLGKNPTFYKDPYKLFVNSVITENNNTQIKTIEKTGLYWKIYYYFKTPVNGERRYSNSDKIINKSNYLLALNYMPTISSENKLIPSNMYLSPNEDSSATDLYPVIICREADDDDSPALWVQPILLMQNQYASSMINDWNGKFKIDEDNGTILSTMVGAGRKNNANQFEGILMGDISGTSGGDISTGIGLYGYNNGAQSFGFKIDGTAFLGKSGRGRIIFDGNNGVITSASYEQNNDCGIKIDLDDGFIDIRGAIKSGSNYSKKNSRIQLNVLEPYFKIDSEAGKTIMYVGSSNYYLQSDNYQIKDAHNDGKGMKINLKDGLIDAYNLKITSKNLILDSSSGTTNYFTIKDNSGNILFNASNASYYLQTSNYNYGANGTVGNGMKINLSTGDIAAYQFNLVAGNPNNGLIILKSSPTTTSQYQYYFYAGNNNSYLNFDSGGDLSIKTSSLILESGSVNSSGYIYLSNISRNNQFKYNDIIKNNILLQVGQNFGVDSSGNLYASGANLKSATVSGTITASTLTATTGGKIGGWTINGNSLKNNNGTVILDGSTGKITSKQSDGEDSFEINADGSINANAGSIGGWKITKNTIESTDGKTGFQRPHDSETVAIAVGATSRSQWASAPFWVSQTGDITAKKGHIGGWLIEDDCLIGRSPDATGEWGDYEYVTAFQPPDVNNCAIAVHAQKEPSFTKTATFYVNHAGKMKATDGEIVGTFTIKDDGEFVVEAKNDQNQDRKICLGGPYENDDGIKSFIKIIDNTAGNGEYYTPISVNYNVYNRQIYKSDGSLTSVQNVLCFRNGLLVGILNNPPPVDSFYGKFGENL